jgi:hypothetical protein
MKQQINTPLQEFFLSKPGIIEIVIDQFKSIYQIEHIRHRSP